MATISDRAICIRHWDFSETSQTVSLFAREQGLIRGLAKGSRRERSNFSGGIDLMTLGDVVAIIKPTTELATITEWGLSKVWWTIRRNASANRVAYYFADCVGRMLEKGDPHPGIFDGLVGTLDAMEDGMGEDEALLRFQWILLLDTGYRPKIDLPADSSEETLAFSAKDGGLVAPESMTGLWRVRRSTVDLLDHFASSNELPPDGAETVRRASRLLAAYLREIMGVEPSTMKLVFPDLAGGRV
ncbi:MAG: DNA repair protein RecO [Phycisphaerales bacterium]|jgi:DNA repair protein RecO (recombination protein O)|nr:DNA repair protein RecO [Phycisphaerales bacterium]